MPRNSSVAPPQTCVAVAFLRQQSLDPLLTWDNTKQSSREDQSGLHERKTKVVVRYNVSSYEVVLRELQRSEGVGHD